MSTSLRIACVRVPAGPTAGVETWPRLAEHLLRVGPRVAPIAADSFPSAPRGAWVDLCGMQRHGDDAALAQRLLAAARAAGFAEARVGLAGGCVAAAMATRERGLPWRAVPPGKDARFIRHRPLDWLPLEAELRSTLELLGLRRCGDLARLSAADVELRFGAAGLRAWRLACGEDAYWPFRPAEPERTAAEAMLEVPVTTMQPLRFVLRGLVSALVRQLDERQRIPAALRLTLSLETGKKEALRVRSARPTADEGMWNDLCLRALEAQGTSGGILGLYLEAEEEGLARADQLDAFRPPAPDPAAVHGALLPLLARWGEGALSRAVYRGAHLPESEYAWEALGERGIQEISRRREPSSSVAESPDIPRAELSLCLRRLDSPHPVRVEQSVDGRPRILHLDGLHMGPANRTAVNAAGPERVSGRWWDAGYAREYWLVEDRSGRLCLLFHDAREARWYLEGWYD